MKAYTLYKYGEQEKLHLQEIPEPAINDHEVLVQVYAASINQLDLKLKSGAFKMMLPYKFPLVLGHDIAGIITKTGAKVSRFKVGEAVFARVSDFKIGGFAEFIAVDEKDLAPKPAVVSMEEAASMPLVALTAWQAFVTQAKLRKGHKVFIQAGSGGVGTIAIQLAKHLGAAVATTTSTANAKLVEDLGADLVIDYRTQNFETLLKEYDLVLNSQDTATLEKSLRILKKGGKMISISGPPDVRFAREAGLSWFMRMLIALLSRKVRRQAKQLGVDYSFLFMQANGQQLSEIGNLVEQRVLHPVVDRIFPFGQINEAMNYVQTGRAKGKVVVQVKQS